METTVGSRTDWELGPRPARRSARSRARLRLSTARLLVLETLENQPEPCTVAAVAKLLRQHTNTVREHLDGLVDVGLAARERGVPTGPGRPSLLYRSVDDPETNPSATEYAGLATALAAQIARSSVDPNADALEAGRIWGLELAAQIGSTGDGRSIEQARSDVVDLLEDLAFSPQPDRTGTTIKLRRCPLLEAAHRNPEVVCAVHLGLVRGALEALGAPPEGTSLLPFAEKGACRLHFEEPNA